MELMTIYNNTPIFMQNMMTTIKGYQYKRERNGEFYQNDLDFFGDFDDNDEQKVKAYQEKELQKLIQFAMENSDFYKKFYKGIDIEQIKTVNDLKKLPILEKEMVRKNLNDLYTLDKKDAVVSQTSGTTGKAIEFLHTYEGIQRRNAILDDFKKSHGFINGQMKKASFNASEIVPAKQKKKVFWRDNAAMKQRLYSSYHTKGENVQYYVENLNKYQPQALDGYPSTLYEVARYINKNDVALTFQPIAIFPTAETLLPHYREEIEAAFNCKVFDQYASSEGSPFVTECAEGNLHYHMLSGVIEQDEDNEMLITTFMNNGTPLIRYRIGDKIEFAPSDQKCTCGSAFPIVKALQGRTGDYIQTNTHGKVRAVFLSLLSDGFKNSIIAMQFIQERLNHVIVNIVPDTEYEASVDAIVLERLIYALGDDMEIELRKIPEIQKDKSGKFKFVVNHLV